MNNWATLVNRLMAFCFFGMGAIWLFPIVHPSSMAGWIFLMVLLALYSCVIYFIYRVLSSRRQNIMDGWMAFCKKYKFTFKENRDFYHTCDIDSMQGAFGGRDFFFWSEDRPAYKSSVIPVLILKTRINSSLDFVGSNYGLFHDDLFLGLKKEAGNITTEMGRLIKEEKVLSVKIGKGELVFECRCDESIPERMLLAASSFADFLENKKK